MKCCYRLEIRPLDPEDGGGYLASFPDLPGCVSDGETVEEAAASALDALSCWQCACDEQGREKPEPGASLSLRLSGETARALADKARERGITPEALGAELIEEFLARCGK